VKLAIGAAAAAVLLTAIVTPPAEALPPTTRTIKDKVEPGKAYDIDIHLSGNAFSEFTVHKAKSFTKDGKDISNKDCARLAMAGKTSKIRLFPECVGSPVSYRVSVKSSSEGKPASADDWAPQKQKFTKKVLAVPLS
jgi:hypothetical protein